jgi:hypothetical protein
VRTPRPPRQTARQQRSEHYAREWTEKRKRLLERRKPLGQSVLRKGRLLRGQEFIRALELAADVTGDGRFRAAIEAAGMYGLDRKFQRNLARVQAELFGPSDEGYLNQIHFLHTRGKLEGRTRRKLSIREACEVVVMESTYPGRSFENAVEKLRKQYMARQRAR